MASLAMRIFENRLYLDGSMRNNGWPYSTAWPFSTRIFTTRPATLASISFMSFIASMMQTIWPSLTTSPSRTYGSAVGAHPQIAEAHLGLGEPELVEESAETPDEIAHIREVASGATSGRRHQPA